MTSPEANDLAGALPRFAQRADRYLADSREPGAPVVEYLPPAALQAALKFPLGGPRTPEDLERAVEQVLRYSVRTGHPRFFNQLYGGADPAGILGDWLATLINTSMYTYEVAPVGTVVELALIEHLNRFVGFPEGEGILTAGGSLSNLMALLAARHRAWPQAKRHGLPSGIRPVLFISAEAHYSTSRAAAVAGLGADAAISIPTDAVGRMIPEELERAVVGARSEGKAPFLVVATSGTTVAGAFDPIGAIGDIAERNGLWLHVDASYGGGVLLSDRYRHLMAGVARADSVAWNPHKMMGLPLTCSVILTRRKGVLEATNGMQADYLFHGADGGTPDLGDRSLQCGRRVDAFKLWFSWLANGDQGYARRVERLFELAGIFRQLLDQREGFHLVREPEGTNVCFRYLPPAARGLKGEERRRREHQLTLAVRSELSRSGRFMLNYAPVDGVATFRMVLSNPATSPDDLLALLGAIEDAAAPVRPRAGPEPSPSPRPAESIRHTPVRPLTPHGLERHCG